MSCCYGVERLAASQLQIGEHLVLLEKPILVFYESGIEEWTLRSNLGRLRHSTEDEARNASDTLELFGAAELNASEQNDSDLRLSAPTLTVEPQREFVSTDQRVELIDTGITQSAQGFDANLQTAYSSSALRITRTTRPELSTTAVPPPKVVATMFPEECVRREVTPGA